MNQGQRVGLTFQGGSRGEEKKEKEWAVDGGRWRRKKPDVSRNDQKKAEMVDGTERSQAEHGEVMGHSHA